MLKQIGKYTISERIGRGIYSRVYRAVDSQGRPVAIKVSTTGTESQHLEEFQKDLVAAASVVHPNLVAVHDLAFEDEFPYLVMELVEGRDLAKLLKSNAAPSLAERIRVMQQTGEALKSAHERGVFHLDVRPSKIMLGEDGAAKLLDLGLGRLSFDPARVTEQGYLVGAPFYMSPERLTAIDTADERCDIWSFGVTFYEWLCGRHPFYDDDGDRMIGNIIDAPPPTLSNVPAALNQAIAHALEKDPADRYQNFTELLADLKPLVGDLKREESDALMAEALKEADGGRWHEARRIARKLRDLEPQHSPSSQIFGFSEEAMERERQVEPMRPTPPPATPPLPPPIAPPARASVAEASTLAAAVDSAEPAPPPPIAPAPRRQRPERTPPRIPPIRARNGGPAAGDNGSMAGDRANDRASARIKTPMPATNGAARMAAAAGAGAAARAAVVHDIDTAAETESARREYARPEYARRSPASSPWSAPPQPAPPHPTVRILKMEEPSGFPWVKILGFAAPAVLMIGALLFFLWPTPTALKSPDSSEEAKQVSAASRVIGGSHTNPSVPQPAANVEPPVALSTAPGTNAQPNVATTDPLNQLPMNPPPVDLPSVDQPRVFDPKSLARAKAAVPPRRRGNGALARLAPPRLGKGVEVTDAGTLPVPLSAPPPPEPVVPAAPAAVPDARESAGRVGGAFAQPVLIKTVWPIYPASAVQRKAQGMVRFQATIAKDGSVKNIQLVSGDPALNVAAKEAVLQWKYRPAILNGEPVEVTQTIVVKFNLSNP